MTNQHCLATSLTVCMRSKTRWHWILQWVARPTLFLHLLAAAQEGESGLSIWNDIDEPVSSQVPHLCKVAPSTQKYHMEDVHRAGGVMAILGELDRAGLLHNDARTSAWPWR